MEEKNEADRSSPSISIGGNVSGPVTVGDGNIVVGSVSEGSSAVVSGGNVSQVFNVHQRSILSRVGTEEEVNTFEEKFQTLNRDIEQEAPQELQPKAKEQAERLITEVTSEKPDISNMEKIKTWFITNLPSFLGTLTGIFTHPIVGKLIEASGEYTLSQFRERLGLPDVK